MTREQIDNWANRFVGRVIQRDVDPSDPKLKVVSWDYGKRNRGIWFTLGNGNTVYRPIPSDLKRKF